jgi:integrase
MPSPTTYKTDKKYHELKRRIRDSGHKCWYFVYNFRGRTRWYRIGQVTLTQARKTAAKLRYEVARGEDPQSERLAQRQVRTFGELADRYLEEHAKRKNKSWPQARALVERHLLPRWGKLDAKSITQADVYAALGKTTDSVFKQTLASASAIFSWAIKVKVLPYNPCTDIETKETKARKRYLSDSEVTLFWPHLTPALKTILLTGQRPGEVSAMRYEHVVDKVWWQMPGPKLPELQWPGTKNGQDNRVFLVSSVRELIGEGETGFVFKRDRLHVTMWSICAKLGITDRVRPHDLRRTWTTIAARLGADDKTLGRVLNHVDRSTAKVHYNHHRYEKEDAAIMEKVARRIIDLVEGRRGGAGTVIRGPFLNEAS